MDTGITIALILGVSSIITSFFWGFIPNVRKRKIVNLETKVLRMAKDIKFLYYTEEVLLSELSNLKEKTHETLKREYRNEIKKKLQMEYSNYIHPSSFEKEIQKYE